MPQADIVCSTSPDDRSRLSAATDRTSMSAVVVALNDYRQPRAARDLADAHRQLDLFLPKIPVLDGLSEWQMAAALTEYARDALLVFSTVMGKRQ